MNGTQTSEQAYTGKPKIKDVWVWSAAVFSSVELLSILKWVCGHISWD